MRRIARPAVEPLEARSLLAASVSPGHGPVEYTVTTDRLAYAVGQLVQVTLTAATFLSCV